MADMTKLEARCVVVADEIAASRQDGEPVPTYSIVRAVLAEAGVDDLLHLVRCYRGDLRRPPSADSIERRLQAIDRALAKVQP